MYGRAKVYIKLCKGIACTETDKHESQLHVDGSTYTAILYIYIRREKYSLRERGSWIIDFIPISLQLHDL